MPCSGPAGGELGKSRGLIAFVVLLSLPSFVGAQQLALRAESAPATREAFLRALDKVAGQHADNWREAALVAATGQPAIAWALEVAGDSAHYGYERRAAAIMVLRYARYREAIPLLKALTVSTSDVWTTAATALSDYPYPELASFWRDLLRHPNPFMRHNAVFGLAASGQLADTLSIRSVALPPAYNSQGIVARGAIDRLHGAIGTRDTLTFAGPPALDGRFTPSQTWLRSARAYLCDTGRCPEERP